MHQVTCGNIGKQSYAIKLLRIVKKEEIRYLYFMCLYISCDGYLSVVSWDFPFP